MYDVFWSNISRAEDAAWKMIAAYSALIAGAAIARPLLTPAGAAFAIIAFGCIGSCLMANSMLWYSRNITLIGKIESNFLNKDDYGHLIPLRWKEKIPFWTTETYTTLLFFAYPLVAIFTSVLMLGTETNEEAQELYAIVGLRSLDVIFFAALLGVVIVIVYTIRQWFVYSNFQRETGSSQ